MSILVHPHVKRALMRPSRHSLSILEKKGHNLFTHYNTISGMEFETPKNDKVVPATMARRYTLLSSRKGRVFFEVTAFFINGHWLSYEEARNELPDVGRKKLHRNVQMSWKHFNSLQPTRYISKPIVQKASKKVSDTTKEEKQLTLLSLYMDGKITKEILEAAI